MYKLRIGTKDIDYSLYKDYQLPQIPKVGDKILLEDLRWDIINSINDSIVDTNFLIDPQSEIIGYVTEVAYSSENIFITLGLDPRLLKVTICRYGQDQETAYLPQMPSINDFVCGGYVSDIKYEAYGEVEVHISERKMEAITSQSKETDILNVHITNPQLDVEVKNNYIPVEVNNDRLEVQAEIINDRLDVEVTNSYLEVRRYD